MFQGWGGQGVAVDGLSGSALANVRGQPWLCLNHTRAADARRSGVGENRRMKRSPFQRCLLPPALTAFGGAWGPNVTPCRCLSCLLTPTREKR